MHILVGSLFCDGFTINHTATCYKIHFLYTLGLPFTHIHHVHNLESLTFIHTLIHIHTHTVSTFMNKCIV